MFTHKLRRSLALTALTGLMAAGLAQAQPTPSQPGPGPMGMGGMGGMGMAGMGMGGMGGSGMSGSGMSGMGMGRMNGMGMGQHRQDPDHMRARWETYRTKQQAELKAKLQLTAAQEPAWAAFTDAIKPPPREAMMGANPPNRDELARMTTPERIDKMRAVRDQIRANRITMQNKREEATKTFYNGLTAEQKKVFDAETYKLFQRPMRHGPGGFEGRGPGPRQPGE